MTEEKKYILTQTLKKLPLSRVKMMMMPPGRMPSNPAPNCGGGVVGFIKSLYYHEFRRVFDILDQSLCCHNVRILLYYSRWSLVKSIGLFSFGVVFARELRGVDLIGNAA